MMEQMKEQSQKASEQLEEMAKKTQKELEKTSKKAQESIEKVTKQSKDSINKATKQGKKAAESSAHSLTDSAREAFHIDIKDDKKKAKPHRRDSSDSDSEEEGLLEGIGDQYDDFTLNQRALGAIGCYVLSGLFTFAATVIMFTNVRHHVRFYAFFYSLSNISTFCSLIFIMGQNRLQKRMLSHKRSFTGHAWLSSLALTVLVAFLWPSHWFIVIVLLLVQFCSMVWYSLSFIPFARKFVHKYMAKRVIIVDAMDGKIDGQ